MASISEIRVVPTTCTLYKLPPELREMVFIQAAFHFFEEQPKLQELAFYPNCEGVSWTRLLQPDAWPTKNEMTDSRIPELERALFGEKALYIECVEARLSLSILRLSRYYKTRDGQCEVIYPKFGRDIPFRVLDSIRHVKYAAW